MSPVDVALAALSAAGIQCPPDPREIAGARDCLARHGGGTPEATAAIQAVDAYRRHTAVNISTLKSMAISPRHYRYACQTPREDTDAMRLGRLMHALVFEPSTIDQRWVVWDGGTRRGKLWDAFLAENPGREVLRAEDWERAEAVAAAVHAHPVAARYLQDGVPERAVLWTDSETGVDCKGRADWVAGQTVLDLKTTRDVTPRAIQRAIASYSYHAQAAFYCDGLGVSEFLWVFAEQDGPHDVVVVRASPATLDAGRALYRGWLARLVECRSTGVWPGVSDSEVEVELPVWATPEAEAFALTMGGEELPL